MTNVLLILHVAYNPGATMADAAKAAGVSIQSIQRRVEALGGYGLVEVVRDPHETRRFLIFLTTEGVRVVQEVLSHLHPNEVIEFSTMTAAGSGP
nr:MarR family transcriptional regulator [Chelatococcus asaccharovorans]